MTERMEVQRTIAAPAADIFAVLCDPQGHVAIDASGMLQESEEDDGPLHRVDFDRKLYPEDETA